MGVARGIEATKQAIPFYLYLFGHVNPYCIAMFFSLWPFRK
jgi:hypothetical protein